MKCRISGNPLHEFMNFGKMPLGNGFLSEKDFSDEYFYEMRLGFCPESKMVQLIEQPAPEKMFHEEYAFFTGTSQKMQQHFQQQASNISDNYLPETCPFIIEIGSNDGTFLKNFAEKGIHHLGIEPSRNVATVAREKGVNCCNDFFSPTVASKIVETDGRANVITAANVICHIPDFHGVLEGVSLLLKENGVFIFEEPYLGDVIAKVSYDQFYDEHVYMFSALSVSHAAKSHGLELIKLEHLETHGGSMRYFLAHTGSKSIDGSVPRQLQEETTAGLADLQTFERFRQRCEMSRDRLKEILDKLRLQNIPVVGYAATSKSTTVTQFCGITPDHLAYICDTTPIKQGKFSPGAHIPVVPYEVFKNNPPPYSLLFAWNHTTEILAKEGDFQAHGGKWIRYVPEVAIV